MKVLVADDDPVTLDTLKACLSAEGYEVLTARNGNEAVNLWRKHHPDLCCLDIMMPGLDGYEVCRIIRSEDEKTPVLFLSAKSEEVDVVVGLQLGADDFVRKPFGKHELLARLKAALRRGQVATKSKSRSFKMNDLVVFPAELRAERNGKTIELSPRDISILGFLFERCGEVVSRDELLDRCWGLEYFPESRTLDQHISRLRKAIERDSDNPVIIETERGMGYRFRPDTSGNNRSRGH